MSMLVGGMLPDSTGTSSLAIKIKEIIEKVRTE